MFVYGRHVKLLFYWHGFSYFVVVVFFGALALIDRLIVYASRFFPYTYVVDGGGTELFGKRGRTGGGFGCKCRSAVSMLLKFRMKMIGRTSVFPVVVLLACFLARYPRRAAS